jgi:hypothetical protein
LWIHSRTKGVALWGDWVLVFIAMFGFGCAFLFFFFSFLFLFFSLCTSHWVYGRVVAGFYQSGHVCWLFVPVHCYWIRGYVLWTFSFFFYLTGLLASATGPALLIVKGIHHCPPVIVIVVIMVIIISSLGCFSCHCQGETKAIMVVDKAVDISLVCGIHLSCGFV